MKPFGYANILMDFLTGRNEMLPGPNKKILLSQDPECFLLSNFKF